MDDPKPMTIREAIEAVKILAPYAPEILASTTLANMVKTLMRAINERQPVDSMRLLSLMEHRTLESLSEDYGERGGTAFALALARGFVINSPLDLLKMGASLGLVTLEEPDAGRRPD